MLPVGDWKYASCAVESDGAGVKGAGGTGVVALAAGDGGGLAGAGGGSEDATADDEAGGDAPSADGPAVDAIAGAVGTAGA